MREDRRFRLVSAAVLAFLAIATLGCAASGAGGREVQVVQGDDGCSPAVIEASPGEKLDLRVKNETGDIYEVEGIDGANLEEVLVPEGRTRSVGFKVPGSGGISKVKCYVPGGVSTIIEIRAGEGTVSDSGDDGGGERETEAPQVDATVNVGLDEYEVMPDVDAVAAGTVRFEATNHSGSLVHELAILRVVADDSLEPLGEIEDIAPGDSGAITVELEPGRYQLACLLVPGEAGSTTDHYSEGMWTVLTVE
jgi:uncharacterized cupredoxin-like copper-binding protein